MSSEKSPRHFSLLQHHISQQHTMPYPVVSANGTMSDNYPRAISTHYHPHTPLPDLNPTIFIPFPDSPVEDSHKLVSLERSTILRDESQEAQSEITSEQAPLEKGAPKEEAKPRIQLRIAVVASVLILALAIYFVWRQTPAPASTATPIVTPSTSNKTGSTDTATTEDTTTGSIQVYVVGAVEHPGVYTLPANARVFQLLQAAGGPLPQANLVAINMAAKLHDGQEVYVTVVGEKPPSYVGGVPAPSSDSTNTNGDSTATATANQGQLVNINTASADELRQQLHISTKTAQSIVDYRQQHGAFTSVENLLQVVSKAIYDKIKGLVTV